MPFNDQLLKQLGQYCHWIRMAPRGGFAIEFSLLCTETMTAKKTQTTTKKNQPTKTHTLILLDKQNQVFRHSQAISVRPILEKPMWFYNGRNQFILMKISFTMNCIGMIRMQMKRITSKFSCFFAFFPLLFLTHYIAGSNTYIYCQLLLTI